MKTISKVDTNLYSNHTSIPFKISSFYYFIHIMQSITTLAASLTPDHLKLALIFILGFITFLSINDIRGQRSNIVSQTFTEFTKPAKDEEQQEGNPFQIIPSRKRQVKGPSNYGSEQITQISLECFLENKYQKQAVLPVHNFLDYNHFIRIQHQIEQQPKQEINEVQMPGQPIDQQSKTQGNLFDSPKEHRGNKLGRLLSPTAIHRRMKKPMKKYRKPTLDLGGETIQRANSKEKGKGEKKKSIRKVEEEIGRRKKNFFPWLKKVNFLKRKTRQN